MDQPRLEKRHRGAESARLDDRRHPAGRQHRHIRGIGLAHALRRLVRHLCPRHHVHPRAQQHLVFRRAHVGRQIGAGQDATGPQPLADLAKEARAHRRINHESRYQKTGGGVEAVALP